MRLGLGIGLGSRAASGGALEWLEDLRAPSDDLPTQALQFTSGNYWDGTEEVAVTALIGDRGFAPLDEFNPASVVAEGGLECFDTDSSVACPQGALLTKLRSNNWTLFVEWAANPALPQGDGEDIRSVYALLTALNNLEDGDEGIDIYPTHALGGSQVYMVDYLGNEIVSVGAADRTGIVNRVAVTFTSAKMTMSLNGEAPVTYTDAVLWANDWQIYTMGKADGGGLALNGWIRKFALYDPQPDADLATMSAL